MQEPGAALPCLFQHVHAQLLRAHPAATAGVQRRDDVLGQEGKVLVDQGRIEDQVGAGGQVLKTAGRGRDVGRIASPPAMDAKRASSQRTGFLRRPLKIWDAGRVRRNKEVAPPAEVEDVVAFASKLFHDVDAAIHQSHHGDPRARATSFGSIPSTCRWSG